MLGRPFVEGGDNRVALDVLLGQLWRIVHE